MPGMMPAMMNPYASLAAFYQPPPGTGGEGDAKSNKPASAEVRDPHTAVNIGSIAVSHLFLPSEPAE